MKIFSFLTLLLLISFQSFAQTDYTPAKITWGAEQIEPNNSFIEKIIPAGDNFYAIRRKTKSGLIAGAKKIFIEKFDKNMKLVKSQNISLKYKNKDLDYEDMIFVNNNLFL